MSEKTRFSRNACLCETSSSRTDFTKRWICDGPDFEESSSQQRREANAVSEVFEIGGDRSPCPPQQIRQLDAGICSIVRK